MPHHFVRGTCHPAQHPVEELLLLPLLLGASTSSQPQRFSHTRFFLLSMASLPPPYMRHLEDWFGSFGGDPTYELESRIRGGVSVGVFRRVLKKLLEANCWVRPPREEETWDVLFTGAGRVRATYSGVGGGGEGGSAAAAAAPPPRYLRKEKEEEPHDFDVRDPGTHLTIPVRLSCNSELPVESLRQGMEVKYVRHKKRHSFNRKNEFQYDLTEVRSGTSVEEARASSKVEYEIELEWVGQKSFEALGGAKALAEKYYLKILDIVALVAKAQMEEARGGGASADPSSTNNR
jgi:hypothetical protein